MNRALVDEWWYWSVYARIVPTWCGIPIRKYPTDLFVYQELIFQLRPAVVIETGGWYGGATLFYAQMLDMLGGDGLVVSIDPAPLWHPWVLAHPRVAPRKGSSIDPAIVTKVRELVAGRRVLVVLDADHAMEHVRAELEAYAPLCHSDDRLIVEDTNINGHPLRIGPDGGAMAPGPWEAVDAFLAEHTEFERDRESERRMGLTCAPDGWLRRR